MVELLAGCLVGSSSFYKKRDFDDEAPAIPAPFRQQQPETLYTNLNEYQEGDQTRSIKSGNRHGYTDQITHFLCLLVPLLLLRVLCGVSHSPPNGLLLGGDTDSMI